MSVHKYTVKKEENDAYKFNHPQVAYYTYLLDEKIIESVKEHFIAFDVETTGLKPWSDRIVEIGAVLFEHGIPVRNFSSLVNPHIHISESVSKINHITDDMIQDAPCEKSVYAKLVEFLGDAMHGGIYVCAHNVNFDMMFLVEALMRMGYSGDIYCLDTLDLSKKVIKNISNYKLNTLACYYGLKNENEHRASSDAIVCGNILINLIYELSVPNQIISEQKKKIYPNNGQKEVCLYVKNMISKRGGDTELIRFRRKAHLVEMSYLYNFLEIYASKEKTYIVVEGKVAEQMKLQTEPANKVEGVINSRYLISELQDIDILEEYIYQKYKKAKNNAEEYMYYSEHRYKMAMWKMDMWAKF